MTIDATPALSVLETPFGPQRAGRVGLIASSDPKDLQTVYPTPLGAAQFGFSQCWTIARTSGEYIWRVVVVGRASTDQLSGPVRIAEMSEVAASLGIFTLIDLAAILSLSLGLTNLLPVPMLDGGHLLFYAIEAMQGRALSRRAQEFGLRIGVAFVASLMLFVTLNDLWQLLSAWAGRDG